MEAWEPHGLAVLDYLMGDASAEVVVESPTGISTPVPASRFFRGEDEIPGIERRALDEARGRVLDLGAGAGCHALLLEARGHEVTALDHSPRCVEVMRRRGVADPRLGDILSGPVEDERFDTIILLMQGAGLLGDMEGLSRFLMRAGRLIRPGGSILLDSMDPGPPGFSSVPMRLVYRGCAGPWFEHLSISFERLAEAAAAAGWTAEILLEGDEETYLAGLARSDRGR